MCIKWRSLESALGPSQYVHVGSQGLKEKRERTPSNLEASPSIILRNWKRSPRLEKLSFSNNRSPIPGKRKLGAPVQNENNPLGSTAFKNGSCITS